MVIQADGWHYMGFTNRGVFFKQYFFSIIDS